MGLFTFEALATNTTMIPIRAVIVTAFEPPATSPIPGELRLWVERERLTQELPFPHGYQPLRMNNQGVLAIVTGMGSLRAAASIMALGMDPRFDLTQAYFLIAGVAGISPEKGSLGSVVLPEYVVDGNLLHELDPDELPPHWPDALVPIGKTEPYQQPRQARFGDDDGIVFHLNQRLVEWAYNLTRDTPLQDSEKMQNRRIQFTPADPAHHPPHVLRGDELSSATFWHGRQLSARATRWLNYQTEGKGTYAVCAMEDSGTLQSLTFLAADGKVDFSRILILRAASNYDQQRPGITAAESLVETNVTTYSAYLPSLENLHRVGSRILQELLK